MDKQIGKYLRRVRRHLELPKNMKDRVMADFISSIQSRRDAGKTDSQIMEELGSPKSVAAVLNEQMKEYTFRKSPWRFLFGALAVYGASRLVWIFFLTLLRHSFSIQLSIRQCLKKLICTVFPMTFMKTTVSVVMVCTEHHTAMLQVR